MTTTNAYEINSHEAFCVENLTAIVSEAWDVCEVLDRYWEYDEDSVGHIAEVLDREGYGELAGRLVAEVTAEYEGHGYTRTRTRRGYRIGYAA